MYKVPKMTPEIAQRRATKYAYAALELTRQDLRNMADPEEALSIKLGIEDFVRDQVNMYRRVEIQ